MANCIDDCVLKKMSEHITYEIFMLCESYHAVKSGNEQVIKNLAIESFGIHLRNLMYFFYSVRFKNFKIRKNDIFYEHYVGDSWEPGEPLFDINEYKKRTDQQIAHVVTDRIRWSGDVESKAWKDIDLIFKHFMFVWNGFLCSLDVEKYSWFDAFMKKWRSEECFDSAGVER